MEARWKEVARSGPTRRSTACADRRSRSRSHTRHTVGAGAAVRVAVTPLLPSCPHRHPPAVGRRPDIASTQISKNHPAPWANFPGSGGRMAKTVTVQSENSGLPWLLPATFTRDWMRRSCGTLLRAGATPWRAARSPMFLRVCACVCMRVCVRASERACVRACTMSPSLRGHRAGQLAQPPQRAAAC